ncbi:MAG: class I SAM-dependent methyltransferase [Ignavibacteriales bacterium]|nr:class I SAM-dependent methyltransferase [Ignavibacteriales bacterium]
MSANKTHWEKVFTTKLSNEVSWFKPHLHISLEMIANAAPPTSAAIIDVGGGDSTLIVDLLQSGYFNVTVLDISTTALQRAKTRLGDQADKVRWLEADITQAVFPANSYQLWHDRAAFHFLTDPGSRDAYIELCTNALAPGGTLILATFAQDGPEKCSGLPTMRYSPRDLEQHFGPSFHLVETRSELHTTPAAKIQSFVYCRFTKLSN